MPIDILLVSILRTLVEVAGFALLGQGVLALLAGKYREDNIFYRVLHIVASPVVRGRALHQPALHSRRPRAVYRFLPAVLVVGSCWPLPNTTCAACTV